MPSQLLEIDTLSDRRDIWHALHRLPPRDRIAFLKYSCAGVPQNEKGHLPVPQVWKMRATVEQAMKCDRADEILTNEIYCDLLSLGANFGLDLLKTAMELEKWVRDPSHRPLPSRRVVRP